MPDRQGTTTGANLVTHRPHVLLSAAMSVDGCLDDGTEQRLVLSGRDDLDRVDAQRAAADAIMVGAGTIRRDDPRLLVRSPGRRAARVAHGRPAHPVGVTLTSTGDLDPAARFFAPGRGGDGGGAEEAGTGAAAEAGAGADPEAAAGRLVYCASPALAALSSRLSGLAEVIDAGPHPELGAILADLSGRGVARLLVEGGADLGRRLLTGGLVDELHLVIAPFFVGDPRAPRFAGPGRYPHGPSHRMVLTEVREVGDVVLLRYLLPPPPGAVDE